MALIQVDRMGVKQAVDEINALRQAKSCFTAGNALLPNSCLLRWEDNHFVMNFATTDHVAMNIAHYQGMQPFAFTVSCDNYEVPEKGASVSLWNRCFTNPDVVEMQISQFRSKGISDEQNYFLRYITPIAANLWKTIDRGLRGYVYATGNTQTQTLYPLHLTCSDLQVHHYVDENGNCFLMIDALSPVSLDCIEKAAFNVLLSFGLLFGEMPLDEAYMFIYEGKDFKTPQALVYKSLVKTLRHDYSIFTSNVYSVLTPLGIRKDPVNGENRMCNAITKRKWHIDEFPLDVFCKMVQNFLDYEALSWGGFYLINACHFTMEMQPGAYSMALETLTSEAESKMMPKGSLNIIDANYWPAIHTALDSLVDGYVQSGQITPNNVGKVKAKINSLSGPTNIDRLCKPLLFYGYPLSAAEVNLIKQRNNALHGGIKASMTIDQAFTQLQNTALGLHRLCCTLLLKMAGYQGYIINNQRMFGCDEKARPFIWI